MSEELIITPPSNTLRLIDLVALKGNERYIGDGEGSLSRYEEVSKLRKVKERYIGELSRDFESRLKVLSSEMVGLKSN